MLVKKSSKLVEDNRIVTFECWPGTSVFAAGEERFHRHTPEHVFSGSSQVQSIELEHTEMVSLSVVVHHLDYQRLFKVTCLVLQKHKQILSLLIQCQDVMGHKKSA